MNEKILIVEDEETLRNSLIRVLTREGFAVTGVDNAEEAMRLLEREAIDLVVTDIILPGVSGIELLRWTKETLPERMVIVMTAFASLETAVETLRAGAYDYVVKPIIHEELKQIVRNALDSREVKQKSRRLQNRMSDSYDLGRIIGQHPEILQIIARVNKLVEGSRHVLITGEIGTGKKLLARAIHFNGNRADRPMLTQDLRLVPPHCLRDRLFGTPGHSPAREGGDGLTSDVAGGTLYLSHVERLPHEIQERLAQLLSARASSQPAWPDAEEDFILIASSDHSPEKLGADGYLLPSFAELFTSVTFRVPPLRERKEDLEPLARFFIAHYATEFGKQVTGLAPEALAAFTGYNWPGNVRELRALLERAVLISDGPLVNPSLLPSLGDL
jgi:two-component system response regulator AtoC